MYVEWRGVNPAPAVVDLDVVNFKARLRIGS